MEDIVFVILHYNTLSTTCDCIESIKKNIDTPNYKIIVVDNCSPNNTFTDLKNNYRKDENVRVIQTSENLGFANGNNYGIDYSRKHFKFRYLCCCNNDILLQQKDFYKKLKVLNNDSEIAAIAPKVYRKDNSIQTYNCKLKTINEYKKVLRKMSFYKKHLNLLILKSKISNLLKKNKKNIDNDDSYFKSNHYDILLHGCCIIFTKVFFENFQGFNPRTFLYKEEELLYVMIKKKNLKTLYNTDLYITHLEDVATNSIVTSNKQKLEFVYKNQINSLKILIDELTKEE